MLAQSAITIFIFVVFVLLFIAASLASKAQARQQQRIRAELEKRPPGAPRPTRAGQPGRRGAAASTRRPVTPAPKPPARTPSTLRANPPLMTRITVPPPTIQFNAQTLREQFLMIELFGPPRALQEYSTP